MEKRAEKKKVVVIGGGTGTHTVLRGLKRYCNQIEISAIVTMADSGGSTGRLRDEFGYLPVGDVRMALAALASDIDEHEELVRRLFLYRFAKGEGLSGHNFGNLLLVALADLLGSEEKAIKAAGKLLGVCGEVLPVTVSSVNLVARYDDGVVVKGEHEIDEPGADRLSQRIVNLSVEPKATITKEARLALLKADLVVLGPGDLYTSLLANCVVDGVPQAIKEAHGKLVYIANLMTKAGQTTGMKISDHVMEVARYLGRSPDVVLVNNAPLPADLLVAYAKDNEFPVEDDLTESDCKVIREDLLTSEKIIKSDGDVLRRSLIRHDSQKLATELLKLL